MIVPLLPNMCESSDICRFLEIETLLDPEVSMLPACASDVIGDKDECVGIEDDSPADDEV